MRARLLDSALALVAKRGVAAASIDDIISAARVSRGTFYKYFDAPDTLLRELALELTNDILRAVHPWSSSDDPAARIAHGMRVIASLAYNHPAVGALPAVKVATSTATTCWRLRAARSRGGIRRRFTAMPILSLVSWPAGAQPSTPCW
jgi:AcrR family transcriptional regulator